MSVVITIDSSITTVNLTKRTHLVGREPWETPKKRKTNPISCAWPKFRATVRLPFRQRNHLSAIRLTRARPHSIVWYETCYMSTDRNYPLVYCAVAGVESDVWTIIRLPAKRRLLDFRRQRRLGGARKTGCAYAECPKRDSTNAISLPADILTGDIAGNVHVRPLVEKDSGQCAFQGGSGPGRFRGIG